MEKTSQTSLQFQAEPELLSRSEVATLLHASLSWVDHQSDLPCYRLGKKKLFAKQEILGYLSRNHVTPGMRKVSKTEALKQKEAAND